jgi:hypothetical protein
MALMLALVLAQEKADWTILVYMSADCDVEVPSMMQVIEMAQAKQSPRVKVVLQCDRAAASEPEGKYTGWEMGAAGNFDTCKRLLIDGDNVRVLADLGETNTGDARTLADFVAWGMKTFPAKRTALVFFDHGSGWPGFGGDDSHQGDMLTLDELKAGLEKGLNGARLDLIGFDCCVMATLEVMSALRPYGKTFVASEELEPGYGWDWTAWLTELVAKPEMTPDAAGRVICDTFKSFFDKNEQAEIRNQGRAITLSAVDLDKVEAVEGALGALVDALDPLLKQKGRELWLRVARAREKAEEYGRVGEVGFHLRDLHNVAGHLKGAGVDSACDALLRAIESAVTHRVNSADRPHGRGIAIYFPPTTKEHEGLCKGLGAQYACLPKWSRLVGTYLEIQRGDTQGPQITKAGSSDSKLEEGEKSKVSAKVTGDDVGKTYFVLATPQGSERVVIGMFPVDPNLDLEEEFDGTWLAIGDEENQVLAPIASYEEVDPDKDAYLVGIPVLYRAPKAKADESIVLYFYVDWDADEVKGQYINAYQFTKSGPVEVRIQKGGRVKPMYMVVDDKGNTQWKTVDDSGAFTLKENALDLVEEDLPDGKYLVGFVVVDLAGNATSSLTEIEIDEEERENAKTQRREGADPAVPVHRPRECGAIRERNRPGRRAR